MRLMLFLLIIISVFFLAACTTTEPASISVPAQQDSVAGSSHDTTVIVQQPSGNGNMTVCVRDSDCGERRIENAYCFQDQPTGKIYDWRCEKAGTPEAYCRQYSKSGIIDECEQNEFCSYGQCVKYANCTDTDEGIDYEMKGTVTINDKAIHEDKCEDDSTLLEYYCSSDHRAFSEEKSCECESGECID